MKIGLIGLPKTGKTTIFNALTGSDHHTDKYIPGNSEAAIGVVQVLDPRITKLADLYRPKKTIYATIEYHDFPGIFSTEVDNPENALFTGIKTMEGFALVLRAFADSELDELYGAFDPLKQLNKVVDEMIINDLIVAEKRIEKIELSYKRGVKTAQLQNEERVLRLVCETLQDNKPLRTLELNAEDEKVLRGFQFFSQKPMLCLLNVADDAIAEAASIQAQITAEGYLCEVIAGCFEEELSKLEADEVQLFLDDMGIAESVKDKLTHLCYLLLGYISFFTVGEDEVRAWTINKGDNAVTAAGRIHSDLARGFIRAECFKYEDLILHGSEKVLKEKGLFRLEGKEYLVKDGDIISIRFNV